MAKCTAPKFGHKRGSAALLSCPACGLRGGVVVKAGVVVPVGGGDLGVETREALAETSKDPEVLAAFAVDEAVWARGAVAKNPNAPAAILVVLAGDERLGVRGRVAENPSAPAAILEMLAGDETPYVRERVAPNPSAPISVVAKLMGDPAARVASIARSRFISWAQETLNLGSAPTEQLIDMLVTLKAWELGPKDPAVVAAVVLCN